MKVMARTFQLSAPIFEFLKLWQCQFDVIKHFSIIANNFCAAGQVPF